ncbi:cbb3-type cytochrome oxidase assembly protein CcoS [Palleronia sp.]|uniref:cbb3-type cytochrome oxidase assembly protein CcoS n=1 Tax=Palleronia sp. TaxID=1940284 RepID=UPI0035C7BA78
MNVLAFLIPVSVTLGLLGLTAFVWSLRAGQYEDPDGDQARALSDLHDEAPAPQAHR